MAVYNVAKNLGKLYVLGMLPLPAQLKIISKFHPRIFTYLGQSSKGIISFTIQKTVLLYAQG